EQQLRVRHEVTTIAPQMRHLPARPPGTRWTPLAGLRLVWTIPLFPPTLFSPQPRLGACLCRASIRRSTPPSASVPRRVATELHLLLHQGYDGTHLLSA